MNMGIIEPLSSKKITFVLLRQLCAPNLDPVVPIITCSKNNQRQSLGWRSSWFMTVCTVQVRYRGGGSFYYLWNQWLMINAAKCTCSDNVAKQVHIELNKGMLQPCVSHTVLYSLLSTSFQALALSGNKATCYTDLISRQKWGFSSWHRYMVWGGAILLSRL